MDQTLAGKSLFLTGATGFLGKAVLEKLLREVPRVEQLYLLVRPRKGVSGTTRLRKEVIGSPIFDSQRQKLGHDQFNRFINSKLHAVEGDVTSPTLGLSAEDAALLREKAQVVIHCAATVQFNEPLDVAVEMNCVGALNVLNFVKSCHHIQLHVHVSTAYVNSNLRDLRIREELYPLDFDVEESMEAVLKASPSELERLHVNLMGTYPNTYALTKSMAEHLIVKNVGSIPLVIYRPTIIGAAWKEPVPGWIDQVAGAGAIFLAVGMGVLTILPGNPRNIADIIPVDLAVNTLLLATCQKLNAPRSNMAPLIVHAGTSDARMNPLRWRIPCGVIPDYWRKNPPVKGIFPCHFNMIQTHQNFQIRWFLSYALPSSVYSTFANQSGNQHHIREAARLWQLTWRARMLVELFKPFTENQWIYNADAMESLQQMVPQCTGSWWMEAKEIVWERYLFNFCVGLKKYILHEDVIDVDIEGVTYTELALSTNRVLEWDPDHHAISFPGLFPDISWAYTSSRKPGYTKSGLLGRFMGMTGWKEGSNHEASHVPRLPADSVAEVRNQVLESSSVRAAIQAEASTSGRSVQEVEQDAIRILTIMAADVDYRCVRRVGWFLRKICRQMYENINVDEKGLIRVRELVRQRKGSLVLVPTHRSYVDFLLLSYLFFAFNIPVPYVAAGSDFLKMGTITKMMRQSGAYFIRRSFRDDSLYSAIFKEYTQFLLTKGHTVEFFMEGSRSRSGKQLNPKLGLLTTVVECYLSSRVENLFFVPVTIDYEKPLEVLIHQKELLGEGKVKESFTSMLKALHVTRQNFGSISVQFGDPIDLKQFIQGRSPPNTGIQDIVQHKSREQVFELSRDLAYELTDAMIQKATCAPSNIVASILLIYRNGISRKDLVSQTNWLRREILDRGGRVTCTQGRSPAVIVDSALQFLRDFVQTRRKDMVEPAISTRDQYVNMIGLGYYRNKLLHWFVEEGILACVFHSLQQTSVTGDLEQILAQGANELVRCESSLMSAWPQTQKQATAASSQQDASIPVATLMEEALFLHELLLMEFVRKDTSRDREQLEQALKKLLNRQVFCRVGKNEIALSKSSRQGEALFSLLCRFVWPFIDSYWVAVTCLAALGPNSEIPFEQLVKRMQWLAETMYHEKTISFYESCSQETLQNALSILSRWKVVEIFTIAPAAAARRSKRRQSAPPPKKMIRLTRAFEKGNELEKLTTRIGKFRKLPHFGHESHLISRLPAVSRL